jgi:hypothetical protein
VTVIANAGSETVDVPSLTVMRMLENVPSCEAVGVPERRPVVVLNVAHVGRFCTPKVSVLPSASEALGMKV